MVMPDGLVRCCPLDNGRHQAFTAEPKFTLGVFDILAPELIQKVLLELDLNSLTAFRRVNQHARCNVDAISKYRAIYTHAPSVLRAALSLGAVSWISSLMLHSTLCDQTCSCCQDFGAYIWLFSCERVCIVCLSYNPDFLPLIRAHARMSYLLNEDVISKIPTIKSLPGDYSLAGINMKIRGSLVIWRDVARASGQLHGSYAQMLDFVEGRSRMFLNFRNEVEFCPNPPGHISLPTHPFHTDSKESQPLRFMAIVRAPWINIRGHAVEWGLPYHSSDDDESASDEAEPLSPDLQELRTTRGLRIPRRN